MKLKIIIIFELLLIPEQEQGNTQPLKYLKVWGVKLR